VSPPWFGRTMRGAIVTTPERLDPNRGTAMGIAIVLLILALVLGGVGLFVEALRWVLIIALVLLILGAVTGARGRGARGSV
jgi:hypothetical protein